MLFSRFKERKGLFALRSYIAFPTNATYRLRAGGSLTTKIHDNAWYIPQKWNTAGRSGEIRTRTEQSLNLLSLPLDYTPIKWLLFMSGWAATPPVLNALARNVSLIPYILPKR